MNNYRLKCEVGEPPVVLCPDTFCPMKTLNMKLAVLYEAQHDGRPWTPEYIASMTDELIDEITNELREEVTKFVQETKPFSIHA